MKSPSEQELHSEVGTGTKLLPEGLADVRTSPVEHSIKSAHNARKGDFKQ